MMNRLTQWLWQRAFQWRLGSVSRCTSPCRFHAGSHSAKPVFTGNSYQWTNQPIFRITRVYACIHWLWIKRVGGIHSDSCLFTLLYFFSRLLACHRLETEHSLLCAFWIRAREEIRRGHLFRKNLSLSRYRTSKGMFSLGFSKIRMSD